MAAQTGRSVRCALGKIATRSGEAASPYLFEERIERHVNHADAVVHRVPVDLMDGGKLRLGRCDCGGDGIACLAPLIDFGSGPIDHVAGITSGPSDCARDLAAVTMMNPEPSHGHVLESALEMAHLAEIPPTDLAVVCVPDDHSYPVIRATAAARNGEAWAVLPDSAFRPGWSIVICSIDTARAAFGHTAVPDGCGPRLFFFVWDGRGLRLRETAAPASKAWNRAAVSQCRQAEDRLDIANEELERLRRFVAELRAEVARRPAPPLERRDGAARSSWQRLAANARAARVSGPQQAREVMDCGRRAGRMSMHGALANDDRILAQPHRIRRVDLRRCRRHRPCPGRDVGDEDVAFEASLSATDRPSRRCTPPSMTNEPLITTDPMPYLDCLRWMLDHGYGILMWPAIVSGGTVAPTKFEPLARAVEQLVAGDREGPDCPCFVAQADAMNGDVNAYLYMLPKDLDLADDAAVARAIETLRDGEQLHGDEASYSQWWVYRCAGVRSAPLW